MARLAVLALVCAAAAVYGQTTSPAPTTQQWLSTPPAPGADASCPCIAKQVWLDVMVLIDSSSSMTADGINQASAYVLAALDKLTIGQQNGFNTRVGVITFGNNATLVSHLTAFSSNDDLFDNAMFPFKNENSANIESAIQLASKEFESANHRTNAQKVILLVSSTYTYGRVNDPRQAAETFRENAGKIITVEYIQEHGDPVPELCGLASSGYCLSNRVPINAQQLVTLFCDANCNCAPNLLPYGYNVRKAPVGGCLKAVEIPTTGRLAPRVCKEDGAVSGINGSVVIVQSENDFQTLTGAYKTSKTKFWLGLKRNGNGFSWQDGSALTLNNKWGPGQPGSSGDCVYMYQYSGFQFGWFTDDCSNDHDYVCQFTPCSSAYYCP